MINDNLEFIEWVKSRCLLRKAEVEARGEVEFDSDAAYIPATIRDATEAAMMKTIAGMNPTDMVEMFNNFHDLVSIEATRTTQEEMQASFRKTFGVDSAHTTGLVEKIHSQLGIKNGP